jgi:thiamine-phosphate pyrophosphorylase
MAKRDICGLYAITPDQPELDLFIAATKAILEGGVRLIQYRNKCAPMHEKLYQARRIKHLCEKYGALFIINDDIRLAVALNADGVHLGENDASLLDARHQLGSNRIVGITCYNNIDKARQAQSEGADYVSFGSFFSSQTKPYAPQASLDLLKEAKTQLNVPIVAIGGITLENAEELVNAGADALAVINALYSSQNPANTAQSFSELF